MNSENNRLPPAATPAVAAEEEATYASGFDWQRYKDDRRKLHEKLMREAEELSQSDAPDADE